jgi:CRISPR-associated protein Cas5d
MKEQSPPIVFSVRAERALFTRPELRVERFTYPVPTFGALAGLLRSIYAKPSFYWVPRRVLVLNPIRYQNILINEVKGSVITKRPFVASERRMQKMQTYLYDAHYIVEAHFEWSGKQPQDEDLIKHMCIFDRSLEAGGRRDVYLGTRECSAIVEPMNTDIRACPARDRFDRSAEEWRTTHQGLDLHVGMMFHSWEWGTGKDGTDTPLFFEAQVRQGELQYPHPGDSKRVIRQHFERRKPQ